jgi:hypothetical protein
MPLAKQGIHLVLDVATILPESNRVVGRCLSSGVCHFINMRKIIMLKTILLALLIMPAITACESPAGPRFQNVRSYSEGLASVQISNGRWGFMNERQQWVIQPRFEDTREFQGGRAAVRQNGKWGFINKRGEWL